jgi:nicotinamide-nucleotide amidase
LFVVGGGSILGHVDDDNLDALAGRLGERLLAAGRMAATAESCTGGWIAKTLTDIAGSSAWFDRGFVTYTNAAKQDLLGVRADTLATQGAVSEATVREMVAGALARSRADVAVAVSGIAGPGGGSPEKPVGTVWLAFGARGGPARAERFRFDGDREAVRRQAVARALQGLDELLG